MLLEGASPSILRGYRLKFIALAKSGFHLLISVIDRNRGLLPPHKRPKVIQGTTLLPFGMLIVVRAFRLLFLKLNQEC
jgi:hypothetical protein